jgi:hypothetical protein
MPAAATLERVDTGTHGAATGRNLLDSSSADPAISAVHYRFDDRKPRKHIIASLAKDLDHAKR